MKTAIQYAFIILFITVILLLGEKANRGDCKKNNECILNCCFHDIY
jgi:hypothetical protein